MAILQQYEIMLNLYREVSIFMKINIRPSKLIGSIIAGIAILCSTMCSKKPSEEISSAPESLIVEIKEVDNVISDQYLFVTESTVTTNPHIYVDAETNLPYVPPPFTIPDGLPEEIKVVLTRLQAMQSFLQTNIAIGLTKNELINKCGIPTVISDNEIIYRFDTGLGGHEWKFKTEYGVVRQVLYSSLD